MRTKAVLAKDWHRVPRCQDYPYIATIKAEDDFLEFKDIKVIPSAQKKLQKRRNKQNDVY